MSDSEADDVRHKLSGLAAQYADELTRSDAQLLALAEAAVANWQAWWRVPESASRFSIEARLDRKFRVCFPLAANAINHVEASLAARLSYPWVAKASARIAFEHALTAQWVLLTSSGEDRLKARMDFSGHKQRKRFVGNIRSLGAADASFAQAAHGLSDEQLSALVGDEPKGLGLPKFDDMCGRFSAGGAQKLLYDVYTDLSGGVHPSWALVRAHFRFSPRGEVIGIHPFGTADGDEMLARELALSAIWALYTMEVCRAGQPRASEVLFMGQDADMPVDLRASDRRTEEQPQDPSAYWLPPAGDSAAG